MVTLETAESALKEVYLGVVSNALNTNANPLLAKIKKSDRDVWGKEVVKLAPVGLNGGIGAGTETGALPLASGNNYYQFKSALKNLYGSIEISDKAIRASQNNAGAFVNLLNAEMEGLIEAGSYNIGRMLYADGRGLLAGVVAVNSKVITVTPIKRVMEGMVIEFLNSANEVIPNSVRRIVSIDRANRTITLDSEAPAGASAGSFITLQNSFGKEITGVDAIFNSDIETLYGLNKSEHAWLTPYIDRTGGILTDDKIQTALDYLSETVGSSIDFISCASNVKRLYQSYLSAYRRNVDYMELQGGFKTMSYAGIPFVSDRFILDGQMFMLNTKDFTLHQLCDWQWLEGEDGKIIKQKQGYPVYYATLVKYAELICDKPNGQAKLIDINDGEGVLSGLPVLTSNSSSADALSGGNASQNPGNEIPEGE